MVHHFKRRLEPKILFLYEGRILGEILPLLATLSCNIIGAVRPYYFVSLNKRICMISIISVLPVECNGMYTTNVYFNNFTYYILSSIFVNKTKTRSYNVSVKIMHL